MYLVSLYTVRAGLTSLRAGCKITIITSDFMPRWLKRCYQGHHKHDRMIFGWTPILVASRYCVFQ